MRENINIIEQLSSGPPLSLSKEPKNRDIQETAEVSRVEARNAKRMPLYSVSYPSTDISLRVSWADCHITITAFSAVRTTDVERLLRRGTRNEAYQRTQICGGRERHVRKAEGKYLG